MSRKVKFACGVCLKTCQNSCVLCETCNTWYHFLCKDMTSSQFCRLSSNPLPYICRKCTANPDGSYNFVAGLNRVSQFISDKNKILHAATCERIFMRHQALPQRKSVVFGSSLLQECAASKHTLVRSPVQNKVAIDTTGDGNCLYNALSIAMYGTENHSLLIKHLTAINLLLQKSKIVNLFNLHRLQFVDWEYENAVRDILTPGQAFKGNLH